MVRLNWVSTLAPLLVSDQFIASQIPVDVTNAPTGGGVQLIAIPSRVNLDFRTPTGVGYMRAFLEEGFRRERKHAASPPCVRAVEEVAVRPDVVHVLGS
jgi:hypothetical protein